MVDNNYCNNNIDKNIEKDSRLLSLSWSVCVRKCLFECEPNQREREFVESRWFEEPCQERMNLMVRIKKLIFRMNHTGVKMRIFVLDYLAEELKT